MQSARRMPSLQPEVGQHVRAAGGPDEVALLVHLPPTKQRGAFGQTAFDYDKKWSSQWSEQRATAEVARENASGSDWMTVATRCSTSAASRSPTTRPPSGAASFPPADISLHSTVSSNKAMLTNESDLDIVAQASLRIREKLLDTSSTLEGYHKVVEDGVKKRKEQQQRHSHEVMLAMAKLEKALNIEIKRRTESIAVLQTCIDKALANMLDRFEKRILERFDKLSTSVENLGARCATLERGIQQFKGELPSKLQVETEQLLRSIKELTVVFERDNKTLVERDSQCLQRVQEAEYSFDHRMQQEQQKFERCAETLQELIDAFAAGHSSEENNARRNSMLDSVANVRAQFVDEVKLREAADDQVVGAINEYTSTLHRSLQRAQMLC